MSQGKQVSARKEALAVYAALASQDDLTCVFSPEAEGTADLNPDFKLDGQSERPDYCFISKK